MSKHPSKLKDIEEKRVGEELYLSISGGESLAVLNTAAMLIWSLCDGQHSPDDIVAILGQIHGESTPEELGSEVEACLEDFTKRGLISR